MFKTHQLHNFKLSKSTRVHLRSSNIVFYGPVSYYVNYKVPSNKIPFWWIPIRSLASKKRSINDNQNSTSFPGYFVFSSRKKIIIFQFHKTGKKKNELKKLFFFLKSNVNDSALLKKKINSEKSYQTSQ